ncbi:MAG: hypothetical protein WB816_08160 [Methylocystis sp.]
MRKTMTIVALTLSIGVTHAERAADSMADHMSMHMSTPDTRKVLDWPAPMRAHLLSNMRGHLEALWLIMAALSAGDGAKAGQIAKDRLGLESPGAGACAPEQGKKVSTRDDMASMMAMHQSALMPDEMKALGYAMHESASKFAVDAAVVKPGADRSAALASLSHVVENCVACHAAYRLK